MNSLGHRALKLLLIIPPVLAVLLGIVLQGAFAYIMEAKAAEAREAGYSQAKPDGVMPREDEGPLTAALLVGYDE
jgi:hypothetical protein